MAIALQVGWHGTETASDCPFLSADRKRRWSDDSEKMLQLMMGQFNRHTETLDLLDVPAAAAHTVLELESVKPLPRGWEKCLDLKTGTVYFVNSNSGKKTLRDPHEEFHSFWTSQSVTKDTKLNKGKSFSVGDCMKMDSTMSSASVFPFRLLELLPENRFTWVGTKSTSEELLLQFRVKRSERQESQLIDTFEKKEENESPDPADESLEDTSLELKLNLEPTSTLAKEVNVNESAFNSLSGSLRDRMLKKSTKVKETEFSTSSIWQPDASPPRSCLAEPRTSIGAASSSSSSAHSLWSLQTQADHRPQSREGEESWSSSGEAYESKKTEVAGDQPLAIVGCANCLMYVMLSKMDPRCPKCGSSAIVDFPNKGGSSSKRLRLA